MQLKDRDIDILTTVSHMRFMNTSQIFRVHGYSGKYGENVTRRKLKDLEEKGFLKSWQPDIYSSKIFYLTKAGAKEVELYNGYENVRTFQRSNKTLHQVMVTEIFTLLKKCNTGKLRRFTLHPKVGEVEPDAWIEYQIGNSIKIILLEADRATETLSIITEKLDQYKQVYDSGEYQKKYGIFPRISFITCSDTRKRALLRLKEKYPYKSMVMTESELKLNPSGLIE